MNRCRLCVIPDTRPDTPFEDGICAACRSFARRPAIDWKARKAEFREILDSSERIGSQYDCVVASSGGKDSHWQVLKVLELGYGPSSSPPRLACSRRSAERTSTTSRASPIR